MNTHREQGYRFMVSPDGREADWIHPLEVAVRANGWHDCTDMNDVEFELFMDELRVKFPPMAA